MKQKHFDIIRQGGFCQKKSDRQPVSILLMNWHYRGWFTSIIRVLFAAPAAVLRMLALLLGRFFREFPRTVPPTAFVSVHPSTYESKRRYIMQKINLRDLYPDAYKTDVL